MSHQKQIYTGSEKYEIVKRQHTKKKKQKKKNRSQKQVKQKKHLKNNNNNKEKVGFISRTWYSFSLKHALM